MLQYRPYLRHFPHQHRASRSKPRTPAFAAAAQIAPGIREPLRFVLRHERQQYGCLAQILARFGPKLHAAFSRHDQLVQRISARDTEQSPSPSQGEG